MGCSCTWKKCCCIYCASSCLLLVLIGAAVGIVVATFSSPEVDMKKTELTGMTLTQSNISFHAETEIYIKNPNNWPITGEVQQLTAKVYSLDKRASDKVGEVYFVGRSGLPDVVTLDPQSEVTFTLNTSIYMKTNDPSFAYVAARLERDCGVAAVRNEENKKTTKIRIVLADIKARLAFVSADLTGHEVPLEMEVPCDAPPPPDSAPGGVTLVPVGPTTTAGGGGGGGLGGIGGIGGGQATTTVRATAAPQAAATTAAPQADPATTAAPQADPATTNAPEANTATTAAGSSGSSGNFLNPVR